MTPQGDTTTRGGPFSPDVTPAQGKPTRTDVEAPEEVEVAFGDDAEGAVGSFSPTESGGVDTGSK